MTPDEFEKQRGEHKIVRFFQKGQFARARIAVQESENAAEYFCRLRSSS